MSDVTMEGEGNNQILSFLSISQIINARYSIYFMYKWNIKSYNCNTQYISQFIIIFNLAQVILVGVPVCIWVPHLWILLDTASITDDLFSTSSKWNSTFIRKIGIFQFSWGLFGLHCDDVTYVIVVELNIPNEVRTFDWKMSNHRTSPNKIAVNCHSLMNELGIVGMSHR